MKLWNVLYCVLWRRWQWLLWRHSVVDKTNRDSNYNCT